MYDDCGNRLEIGDRVAVVMLDASRGATLGLTQGYAVVSGLARTRVVLDHPGFVGTYNVGPECLRVVRKADGSTPRNWSDRPTP